MKGTQSLLVRNALAQQPITQFDEGLTAVHENTSLVPGHPAIVPRL
jgi:hypothetical protein